MDVLKKSDISLFEGRETDLLIESYSNATRILQIRGFTEDAQIVGSHTTNSDRSLASSSFSITGVPVTITVRAASTGVQRGACYVKIWLRVEGVVVGLLGAAYITDTSTLQWPSGKFESSIDGPGLIRSIAGTNPAAGVEISETVPTGAKWRLLSWTATLVADATVATRRLALAMDDGATTVIVLDGTQGQTASATSTYGASLQAGYSASANGTAITFSLPKAILSAGYRIKTATVNLQAADNWSAPQMLVEEWIEP